MAIWAESYHVKNVRDRLPETQRSYFRASPDIKPVYGIIEAMPYDALEWRRIDRGASLTQTGISWDSIRCSQWMRRPQRDLLNPLSKVRGVRRWPYPRRMASSARVRLNDFSVLTC
jgi:hypothetical protein